MTDEIKLVTREVTSGRYRGITFEINHPHDGYKFAYYVYLRLKNFEDKELAESLWVEPIESGGELKRKYTPYSRNHFLTSIEMHGGITYYSKHLNDQGERVIKIGCDYGHIWDDGQYYTVESIVEEVKETIDCIHKAGYLMYCSGDGRLVKESEGVYKSSWFYSNEYLSIKGEG